MKVLSKYSYCHLQVYHETIRVFYETIGVFYETIRVEWLGSMLLLIKYMIQYYR